MEIILKIVAPELCEAMKELARALCGRTAAEDHPVSDPFPAPAPAPAPKPAAPAVMPVAPAQPAAPAAAVPVAAAPTYSADQLANAAAELVRSGKLTELQELLSKYGIQALPQLQPAQYGAFATDLRGLGARI